MGGPGLSRLAGAELELVELDRREYRLKHLLKTIEGVGSFAGSALKGMFKKNLLTKLAALLVMPGLNAFKARLDPNKVGGTAFIGISRPVIKAHGASNAEAIENAVGQAVQVAQSGIVEAITANIDKMQMLSE